MKPNTGDGEMECCSVVIPLEEYCKDGTAEWKSKVVGLSKEWLD
jgi:hypothetical protein